MNPIVLRVIDQGIVYCGERDSPRQSATFPAICVLPSGRWICTWRVAPVKSSVVEQHILINWSDDQGHTWSKPAAPFAVPRFRDKRGALRVAHLTALGDREMVAALCWVDASDASLPFFNEATEGLLDTRILLSRSDDDGENWSSPEWMNTAPFDCPTPLTGPILTWPDGRWACQFELNKAYNDVSAWTHKSILMFSEDRGRSWSSHQVVSEDPENRRFYWDQRPGVLPGGHLLDLFWTYDRQQAAYLNIHARFSEDGRRWSPMWDTGVPGQPAPPIGLRDGAICMIYVDRTSAPAIKARISSDGGRTWPVGTESLIYSSATHQNLVKRGMLDAWREMVQFSAGLPATALLPGDDILVVYYAGSQTDWTSIRWARLSARE